MQLVTNGIARFQSDGPPLNRGEELVTQITTSQKALLDARYRQESGRRYGEWVNYSRARASDRRLVTYFSFEGDRRPGSRVLVLCHSLIVG
jgi:hypothetical protein